MAIKFFRRGVSKIYFLPAVAGASPTSGEIAAGTDLSPQINNISGFQMSNQPIEVPVLSTQFVGKIDGPDTVADSTITFLDHSDSATLRTLQAKGTAGFLVLMPYGNVSSKRCEVWPAKSTGVNDEWSLGNDPARFVVGYVITSLPTQTATLP